MEECNGKRVLECWKPFKAAKQTPRRTREASGERKEKGGPKPGKGENL